MASIPLQSASLANTAAMPSVGQQQADRLVVELTILAVTSVLSIALYWAGSYNLLAVMIPLVLLTVNAVANFRMVVADPAMLLTPLFGVRLIAMVVFGIGGLFDAFAPANIRIGMDYLFPSTAAEVARVNLLWLLGMTVLIAGMMGAMRFHPRGRTITGTSTSLGALPLNLGLWVFLVAGAFQLVQAIAGLSLPGIVQNFVLAFELCGLFLVGQHVGTEMKARIALGLGLAALFIMSLLVMAKTVFLYPALIAVLGTLSNRLTWRRTLAGAFLIFLSFVIISPIVSYSRERMANEFGIGSSVSVGDRWRYIMDYAGGDRIREDDVGFSLSRLDYVMPASFVMAQYDQGMASDRLATSAYIFIPRLIWPDKPITSGSGLEVNYAIGIQGENQIGTTIFADLYWAIGWYGLALIAVLGVYFGVVTIMCHGIIRRGEWLLLPFALSSLRLGLNLDSDFTAGMMAPAVINLAMYAFLRFASRLMARLPGLAAALALRS